MANVPQRPRDVVIAQAVFFFNAGLWVLFALFNLGRGLAGPVLAVFMFGNAAAMLLCG